MLSGILLDLVLLILLVAFAVMGYRQGFIVGALSFVGFVGGGVLGTALAPPIARSVVSASGQQALLALVLVFLTATIGQLVASSVGSVLRERLVWDWESWRADAIGGSFISAIAVLMVAWLLGSAVARSPFDALRYPVANSNVLAAVEAAVPNAVERQFAPFRRFVDQTEFPEVFGGLAGDQIVPVAAPDPRVLDTREFRRAQRSIVKVEGVAPSCGQRIQGTGFVFASRRVMTNAHVVAGVTAPSVITQGGIRLRATVVEYDPARDVAVLNVPRLRLRPLRFRPDALSGDHAVVAGFPKGKPFTAVAARIRAKHEATAVDIYGKNEVTRQIYSIRGKVRPGNSGGPLLAADGTVFGVIFAAARDDAETGYVLTTSQVAQNARRGRVAQRTVPTGGCTGATG